MQMREERFRKYYAQMKQQIEVERSNGTEDEQIAKHVSVKLGYIPNRVFTGAQIRKIFDLVYERGSNGEKNN